MSTLEAWFERQPKALEEISEFVSRFGQYHGLSDEVLFCIQLATEEVFTNMPKYECSTRSKVRIVPAATASDVSVIISGYDVDRFDITQTSLAEFEDLARAKSVGGRGIALIRRLWNSLHHEYTNRVSTLTMRKAVGQFHAGNCRCSRRERGFVGPVGCFTG